MVVTDPPDPLADLTRQLAGHARVFSAGTMIDSLRFRTHIAERLSVNVDSVYAMVIGDTERRRSSFGRLSAWAASPSTRPAPRLACPSTMFAGVLKTMFGLPISISSRATTQANTGSASSAPVSPKRCYAENMVFPVANYHGDYGLTLSLPSVLGKTGVTHSFMPRMTESERAEFQHCVDQLKTANQRIATPLTK
jgi:L-lactate dehydrogenase